MTFPGFFYGYRSHERETSYVDLPRLSSERDHASTVNELAVLAGPSHYQHSGVFKRVPSFRG